MRLPRRVPWSSISELEQLCSWIYSEEADNNSALQAIHRLSAWRVITHLPHALEATLSLLVVFVQDTPTTQSLYLRQAYAAAIIRLVNGFVDPLQLGAYARSITSIAQQLGLPQWLVELRHAATHEELPSLELLREAAKEAKTWLLHNYFLPTLNPSTAVISQAKPIRPLAPLLNQYKSVSKITIRDASLANTYRQTIAALVKEIERWISEAKVAANLAAGNFGWETSKVSDVASADDDDKEHWALDKLCDALLEKGVLVPMSKKKRICPSDTYTPPPLSLQVWGPLLDSLQSLHPDLPSVLCSRIVACLTSVNIDATFAACLARWLFWIVETWDSNLQEHMHDLRKEVVICLMQALGHAIAEADRKFPEAREVLLKLCDAKQEWQAPLALLLQSSFSTSSFHTDQIAHDIDLMNQRLSMLQSLSESNDREEQGGNVEDCSAPSPSTVTGWRQLTYASWRPCPIGMYCPPLS